MFLLLDLSGKEVYIEEVLRAIGWVRGEVFIECHGLEEARSNTVQDDVDLLIGSYLGIDIESINIVHVFLDSTCLLEITNPVRSPVQLVVVTIVLSNGISNIRPGGIPIPASLAPFHCFNFPA